MNRIKELRVASEMRQEDLAQHLNVSKVTVSRYELEQRQLDPATIHQLCDLFGCTADYLLGRSEARSPEISQEELRLLLAWREAPDHVKDAIRLLLAPPSKEEKTAV